MQRVDANEARDLLNQPLQQPVIVQEPDGQSFVVVSPGDYQQARVQALTRLRELCEQVGMQAEANGLIEESLAELLAEDE